MRLIEANRDHNRRFHELPTQQRIDFLLKGYSEVFATEHTQMGEFTPPTLSPNKLRRKVSKDERSALFDATNNLNFLMTRFTMLGDPQYEGHIRELALLRYEYMFLLGQTEITQCPQLVADFYSRRGKPELIRPALERMGEHAIDHEFLAKRIIDSPAFQQHVGEDTITYKFRTRLHTLVKNDDYSKEQAASTLMKEGFDLVTCDFNRWYKFETDFSIKMDDKHFKRSAKETKWLADFVAERSGHPTLEERTAETTAPDKPLLGPVDDEKPSQEHQCSKEELETLDQRVNYTISEKGNQTPPWVRELSALTSDHAELTLNSANLVEAKMWDYIWGGQFNNLAYQLKGANPQGRTRLGLNYNKWALTHEEHSDTINPILAQDSYAMIVAGDILVGDLETAIADLQSPDLQRYKNPDKVRAAVTLAWELMQQPGESDDPDNYEPPRGYLYHVAQEFAEFLSNIPSAAPYLALVNATNDTLLGEEEERILASIRSFDAVERIYTQIGRIAQIKDRLLEIFDQTYDNDTEFISVQSEIRGTVEAIQHPVFRKHVDDETIGQRLYAAVERTLQRKRDDNPKGEESGSKKLVLTLYQNTVLHPYLERRINIGAMVNGMIDDVVHRKLELLTKPLSLRHGAEISIIPSTVIEAYMLADRYRDVVDPQKMQDLVAYLLAINSEMTVSPSFSLTSMVIDKVGEEVDPDYQRPDYFPDKSLPMEDQRIAFLTNVYQREKKLGGLDTKRASTGVTNVIFRGTYIQPGRFYPQVDSVMRFLDSPLAELLPAEGLGHDAIKEYEILREFLRD